MPFNGSGGFVSVGAPNFPAVDGTTILASQYNTQLNDIFNGLSNAVTRDGQSPATANLPMGGFNFSNLGDGTVAGRALVYGQTSAAELGGVLRLPGGAVGAPSYTFTGDTNNGWWSPAADVQAWSIAGAELMRLNATGLGIGATPTYRVDITGSAGNGVRYSGPTAQVLLGEVGNIGAVGTLTNHALQIIIGGTERARFDTSGKLGLGSSPTYDFDLSKSVAGSGVISRVRNASNAAGVTYGLALVESDVVSGGMTAWSSAGTRASQFWVGTGSNHSVIIGTNDTERVLVDTSGRVRINGAPAVTSGYLIARVAAGRNIGFYDVSSVATIQAFTDVAAGASLRVAGNTLLLSGDNGGTSAVQIDPSSRVGINRAPTTDRLEVQGATLRWGRFGSTTANVNYAVLMRADDTNALGYFGSGTGLIGSGAETDFVMRSEGDLVLARSSTVGLRLISDGRLQIPAIHNNASGAAGTTPMIASGTYTPTLTAVNNFVGSPTANSPWPYIRVGNVVTVYGSVSSTGSFTAGNTMTQLDISLPIASNFTVTQDLHGHGTCPTATAGGNPSIDANTTSDRATLIFTPSVTTGTTLWFSFSYVVK
ncbi:MAG: hypothetical protein AB7U98_13610 [Candidatus Nitrosocosmicus sp.]